MTSGQEERNGLQGSSSHRGSQIENCDEPQRSEQAPVPQPLSARHRASHFADTIKQVAIDGQNRVLVPILQKQNAKMRGALELIIKRAEELSKHDSKTGGGLDGWNSAEAKGADQCADIAREALGHA